MPEISVIMGIYNCAEFLQEAIDSILAQTYSDWELIMCDDGSSDETLSIADTYHKKYPEKIKLIKHEYNQGLNQTLNDCLKIASGKFIARMDGDDISLPERFAEELKAFAAEPDLAVVSCPMLYFDKNRVWGQGSCMGNEYPDVRKLARGVIHCHAPAMIRSEVMRNVGGYTVDRKFMRVEDWNLWIKIYAAGARGRNLPRPYYMVRDDENALRRKKFSTCLNELRTSILAIKTFKLPIYYYLYSVRPVAVGLLPRFLYSFLHRLRIKFIGMRIKSEN